MSKHIATYYFDMDSTNGTFDIYEGFNQDRGIWCYNIYNKDGECVSENDPFLQFPTWQDIYENYYYSL